ncbi:MAG: hypothetical protein K0B87_03605 [Candidatus Syntrophosphaera sp.]|nr:hypothetical protein [Candidatus Syntrophosphaera sp.]
MKKHLPFWILNLILLLITASCIVHSSLVYLDKDTEGVPNLVTNPGFDAYSYDAHDALLGWTVHVDGLAKGSNPVFIDGGEAFESGTSLRIDASENTVTLLSDAFKVRRYGGYYIRLWGRSSQPRGPHVTLRFLTFRDNGSVFGKYRAKLKTRPEWKRESISTGFHKPGVSFGRLQIVIPPFSEGSVWLDNTGCWEVHHFRID